MIVKPRISKQRTLRAAAGGCAALIGSGVLWLSLAASADAATNECHGLEATIVGTGGGSTSSKGAANGGSGADFLEGGPGSDRLTGNAGPDEVFQRDGSDRAEDQWEARYGFDD